jgi:hypothetical protein
VTMKKASIVEFQNARAEFIFLNRLWDVFCELGHEFVQWVFDFFLLSLFFVLNILLSLFDNDTWLYRKHSVQNKLRLSAHVGNLRVWMHTIDFSVFFFRKTVNEFPNFTYLGVLRSVISLDR